MNARSDSQSQLAHKQFSVDCFNETWRLIDVSQNEPEPQLPMLLAAAASLWHWTQRSDCTSENLSIGYWLLSRVLAMIGEGALAKRCGEQCLEHASPEAPFYMGYAYESLARAAATSGDFDEARRLWTKARQSADGVESEQDQAALLQDLETITLTGAP